MEIAQTKHTHPLQAAGILIGLGLVAGTWMWTHAYHGIQHDATLYSALALSQEYLELTQHDLFIRLSEQGRYTIYDELLAYLRDTLGNIGEANITLTMTGLMTWLGSLLLLSWSMYRTDSKIFWLFPLLVASFPGTYGGFSVFQYAEPYATPRLFAEGISLAAVALAVSSKFIPAIALLIASSLIHPLTTLTAGIFLAVLLFPRYKKSVASLVAFCILLTATGSIIGISPFDAVTMRISGEWLFYVQERNSYVFLTEWRTKDVALLAWNISIIFAALLYPCKERERDIYKAVIIATSFCLIITFIGADILKNQLVTQIQPWRITWITRLIALAALARVIISFNKSDEVERIAVTALLLGALAPSYVGTGLLSVAAGLGLYIHKKKHPLSISANIQRIFYFLIGVILLIIMSTIYVNIKYYLSVFDASAYKFVTYLIGKNIAFLVPVLYLLAAGSRAPTGKYGKIATSCMLGIVATYLTYMILIWDQRSSWSMAVEGESNQGFAEIRRIVPPNASIYWPNETYTTWLALKRPFYASAIQGSAAVFSEDLSMQLRSRFPIIASLNGLDAINDIAALADMSHMLTMLTNPDVDMNKIPKVCKSDPELGYVIVSDNDHGVPYPHTVVRIPVNDRITRNVTIIDCHALRMNHA